MLNLNFENGVCTWERLGIYFKKLAFRYVKQQGRYVTMIMTEIQSSSYFSGWMQTKPKPNTLSDMQFKTIGWLDCFY